MPDSSAIERFSLDVGELVPDPGGAYCRVADVVKMLHDNDGRRQDAYDEVTRLEGLLAARSHD
jgi:hypothetical protein